MGLELQRFRAKAMQCGAHGPTACDPHGTALPGPHARDGAGGKDLQTLRDMISMGTCGSAEQYPRWHLLWQIQAVIQIIRSVFSGEGKIEAILPSRVVNRGFGSKVSVWVSQPAGLTSGQEVCREVTASYPLFSLFIVIQIMKAASG